MCICASLNEMRSDAHLIARMIAPCEMFFSMKSACAVSKCRKQGLFEDLWKTQVCSVPFLFEMVASRQLTEDSISANNLMLISILFQCLTRS